MKINEMTTENDNKGINDNKAEEPSAAYETTNNKTITFFNSFEEAKEQSRKEMAETSYEQRLINLQIIRERSKYFKPVAENKILDRTKTIVVIKAHYL